MNSQQATRPNNLIKSRKDKCFDTLISSIKVINRRNDSGYTEETAGY